MTRSRAAHDIARRILGDKPLRCSHWDADLMLSKKGWYLSTWILRSAHKQDIVIALALARSEMECFGSLGSSTAPANVRRSGC